MMMQIKVSNSTSRVTIVVDDTTTIRQAFEQANITPQGLLSFNGVFINASEMDRQLNTFNANADKTSFLSCVNKTENACTITVVGDTVAIKTTFKYDDLALIEKMEGGITITDDDTDEEIFKIVTGEEGSLTKYGMVVPPTGVVTIKIPAGYTTEEERKEFLYDTLAATINMINQAEENIAANGGIEELKAKRETFLNSITFIA